MSNLIEVKAVELIGPALDWVVAIAINGKVYVYPDGGLCPPAGTVSLNEDDGMLWTNIGEYHHGDQWRPSTDWSQCGPLIDKYKPWLSPPVGNDQDDEPYGWDAEIYSDDGFEQIAHIVGAPTALVAVCRAIVFAKLGETVKIPLELIS